MEIDSWVFVAPPCEADGQLMYLRNGVIEYALLKSNGSDQFIYPVEKIVLTYDVDTNGADRTVLSGR